jgi:hypothetical protein
MQSSTRPAEDHGQQCYLEPPGPSACPACGSRMLPFRGVMRCSLCALVIAEGPELARAASSGPGRIRFSRFTILNQAIYHRPGYMKKQYVGILRRPLLPVSTKR